MRHLHGPKEGDAEHDRSRRDAIVWAHAEPHRQSGELTLRVLDGTEADIECVDALVQRLRFKCALVLRDARRIGPSMERLLRTTSADIVHFETALHCVRKLNTSRR